MCLVGKRPQMTRQLELPLANRGETPTGKRSEEAPTATHENERSGARTSTRRVFPRLATQPQLLEPPGADPHAGWCGRGSRCNDPGPLCRSKRSADRVLASDNIRTPARESRCLPARHLPDWR